MPAWPSGPGGDVASAECEANRPGSSIPSPRNACGRLGLPDLTAPAEPAADAHRCAPPLPAATGRSRSCWPETWHSRAHAAPSASGAHSWQCHTHAAAPIMRMRNRRNREQLCKQVGPCCARSCSQRANAPTCILHTSRAQGAIVVQSQYQTDAHAHLASLKLYWGHQLSIHRRRSVAADCNLLRRSLCRLRRHAVGALRLRRGCVLLSSCTRRQRRRRLAVDRPRRLGEHRRRSRRPRHCARARPPS
eukprot:363984-Chlamydomonas_euryale.AAC.29